MTMVKQVYIYLLCCEQGYGCALDPKGCDIMNRSKGNSLVGGKYEEDRRSF